MLISTDWIKDFVELDNLSAKEIAENFTLSTAEVEDIKSTAQGLDKVICVQITSIKPHPDAEKLNLVSFSTGSDQLEVVCGAPNVKVGLKVPFAPIGSTLPNGMILEPKKIRGILSQGMLCSEVELGLGEGKSGLMELTKDAQVGARLIDVLELKSDIILDVDNKSLTHRPDLWGHYGLAREFSCFYQKKLKNPYDEIWQKKVEGNFTQDKNPVEFIVSDETSCLAYLGISITGVKNTSSPDWIQTRLKNCGMKPISLLVDISNYVMLELGMPNHIFDAKKITSQKLVIKSLPTVNTFQTLDGVKRELTQSDTVICDADTPLVLAGIMGGQSCAVDESTSEIFIEVANWEASKVRKTSTRLGLRTDSSQRFEKSLDSHQCYKSILRIVELVLELIPGSKVRGCVQKYFREDFLAKELTLTLSHEYLEKMLGIKLDAKRVESIFQGLGFQVQFQNDYQVTIPTFRTTKDITNKADLVEEIGRMIGYDNILSTSPLLPVFPVRLSPTKTLHRKIQDFMRDHFQSLEIMTYPMVGEELLKKASFGLNENLKLVNALSVDNDRMRPSLIPSALESVSLNAKNFSQFSFFELGRAYLGFENEQNHLLVGLYSKNQSRFKELLNGCEKLFASLQLPVQFVTKNLKFKNSVIDQDWIGLHPYEFLNFQMMGKFQGICTLIHPIVLKQFKIKGFLALAVVNLSDFESRTVKDKNRFISLGKFPSSTFDCTVVAPLDTPARDVLAVLSNLKLKEIKKRSIVGVYQLNESEKSITLRTVFEDPTQTLSSEFIKTAESQVVQVLEKSGFLLKV